jgi:hypothetical protein
LVAGFRWLVKQKLGPRNLLLPDSPTTHEAVLKHTQNRFSLGTKSPCPDSSYKSLRSTNQETAMTAIAKAFSNVIPTISPDVDILRAVGLFCGVALVVSVLLLAGGVAHLPLEPHTNGLDVMDWI